MKRRDCAANRAARRGLKPVCLAIGLLGSAPAGWALPQGAVPTSGQTTVQQVAPGQLQITQGSARAGIDWASFSIAAGETVRVQQPGPGSVLLNRVVGQDPSLIHGSLQSNGSVWLINPRGIVFGAASQVDVGSLVASTLAITQDDVAAGRLVLGRSAGGAGSIVSQGHIRAASGTVVLAAPQLQQGGVIEARRIGLAAATDVSVDVEGDGLVLFNVRNDGTLDTRLAMQGRLRADGGSAEVRAAARAGFADTVLNLEGVVQARSLGVRHGRIVVDGGRSGITRLAGTLDASGYAPGQSGGHVQLTGQNVLLDAQAVVDASGAAGGGRVQVGGGFQGRDAAVPNAERLVVRGGARLAADATAQGDGGEVILWSDVLTRYHGSLSARGGALGGHGGLAEVSGKEQLDFRGTVDLGSALGLAGVLWLDPNDIEIVASGDNLAPTLPVTPGDPTVGFDDTPNNAKILNTTLDTLLANQTVILQAKDDITVSAPVTEATGSLTLEAGRHIVINAPVATRNLTLNANDPDHTGNKPGTGRVQINAGVNASGGALVITNHGGTGVHQIGADLGSDSLTITGPVALTSASQWTVEVAGQAQGALGGDFLLTKAGAGRLVLGTASTHGATFGMAVTGGTLALGNSTAAGPGAISLGGSTTLEIFGGATLANSVAAASGATLSATTGGGTLGAGTLTLADGATLNLGSSAGSTLTVARVIAAAAGAGAESVAVSGAGTVNLSTANTYAGGTTVNAGTLRLADAAAAGTGTVALNAATLSLAGGLSLANPLTVSGNAQVTHTGGATLASGSALTLAAGSTLTLAGTGGELNVARVVDGSAGTSGLVTSGTVLLAGANTFDGGVTVNGGTLRLADASAAGTGTVQLGSHTLDLIDGASIANALVVADGATLGNSRGGGTLAAGTAVALAGGSTLNLSSTATGLLVARGFTDGGGNASLRAAAGTVTLAADHTLGGSTTVDSGATLVLGSGAGTGNATTGAIANQGTLRIDRSNTLVLGSVISGSGALQQAGAGTTVLAADNSYSGGTTLGAGVLQLGNGGTTGTAGSGTLTNDATLRVDRSDTLTLGSAITGTGALVQAGSGITVLDANHAYAGGTTLSAGTLRLRGGASAGTGALTLAGGVLDLADGASLGNDLLLAGSATLGNSTGAGTLAAGTAVVLPNASTLTLASTGTGLTVARTLTDGAGSAGLSTAGTVVLAAANSVDGGVTVTGGTLRLAHSAAVGSGAIALGTHTLDITGGAVITNGLTISGSATLSNSSGAGTLQGGTLALAGGNTLTLGSAGSGLTVGRVLDDGAASANLLVTAGTVTLTADNTLSGSTSIASGATLVLGDGGTAGSVSAGAIANLGLLRINRSNTLTLAGTLSGGGNLEQAGTGTTVLGSALNSHGDTLVAAGVLEIASAGALGSGSVTNNATMQVHSAGTVVIGKTLAGSGGLSLVGGGTTVLTAANGYGGGTTVAGGTLRLQGGGSAGTGAIALGTATLDLTDGASWALGLGVSGNATVANSSGSGTLAAGPALTLAPGSTLTLDASGGTGLAVARVLTDGAGSAGLLTRGTVTLSAANSVDGGVAVDSGTLRLGHGSAAGTGTIALGTHTLDLFGGASIGNTLTLTGHASLLNSSGAGTLAGGAPVGLADGSTLTLSSTGTGLTVGRVLDDGAGSAALRAAAGTVRLSADNTLDGRTTVASGATLVLGSGGATGTATRGAIGNDGVLRLERATPLLLDGAISGTGSLQQAGSGTTTLAADNSYSGGTQVLAGTLVLGQGGSAGTAGSGAITNSAVLRVNRSDAFTLDNTLAGTGSLEKTGAGLLTLRGANSTTGGTTIGTGTLEVADGGGLGAGPVANAGTLRLNLGGALTIPGAITGAGALVQAGSGSTTLTGASLYSGGTQVSGGRLVLDGATARAGSGPIQVGAATLDLRNGAVVDNAVSLAGGTLDNGGGTATLGGTLTLTAAGTVASSGGGLTLAGDIAEASPGLALDKAGGGTVTLAGVARHTGATQLLAGTLQTGAADRFAGDTALVIGAGTTLDLGGNETFASLAGAGNVALGSSTLVVGTGNVDTTFSGLLSGSGSFTKLGTGTLTLAGAHGLTGATTVAAGRLQLAAAERLSAATALQVDSGATLALAGNQTVASAVLRGTLSGSGTLSAASTALDGATVTASLGAGTLTSMGLSTLAGSSAASSLNVTGGTLVLASAGRLAPTMAVSVGASATLSLAGNETLGSLALSGTLAGSGTLSAATVALAGGSTQAGAHLGAGALTSTGNSTLGGTSAAPTVTVQSGTLALGAPERLANTAALSVHSGATLALAGPETVDSLALAGALAGAGELVATRYTLDGGNTAAGAALGAGALIARGNSQLGGAVGATTLGVETGTLTLGAVALLAPGAALDVAGGATLLLGGSQSVQSLALAGTLGGSGLLTAATYALSGGRSDAALGAGQLSSTGSSQINATTAASRLTVSAGQLRIGGAGLLSPLADLIVATGARVTVDGDNSVGSLDLAGTIDGTGRLSAASTVLNSGSATSDLLSTVLISRGTSSLSGTSAATTLSVEDGTLTLVGANRLPARPAIRVAPAATLALGGAESATSLALGGTLGGSGTLTADSVTLDGGRSAAMAALVTAAAVSRGSSSLAGSLSTPSLRVDSGSLTLASAGRLSGPAAVTVDSASTLVLAGAESAASLLLAGTLADAGTGAALFSAPAITLAGGRADAALATPSLRSTGTSVINAAAAAGTVDVAGGTLALRGANRLADTAAVTVAAGATLALDGADTVASLLLAGRVQGSGTLTAASYTLDGGVADVPLGAGALLSRGGSQINAAAAVNTLSVDSGTLALGPAAVLSAAPAVLLDGALTLGGAQVLGTLRGTGSLALGAFELTVGSGGDARFDGTLGGTGALVKQGGGRFTVGGVLGHTGGTTVAAGTLALAASEQLADGAAVSVAGGATLELAGTETLGALTLAGTLASTGSSGRLLTPTATLAGGTLQAALDAGTVASTGASRVEGRLTAGVLSVDGGTLTLAAADRLADTTTLTVAAGATLALAGADTVASLALAGTLAGPGTLTAATYSLSGGTADAPLGAGSLRSSGNSRIAGAAAVDAVAVDAGTLTLAGMLGAAPAVTVAAGATVALSADQAFGTLQGAGTVHAATHTLALAGTADAQFDGALQGTGALLKQGSARFTLTGDTPFSGRTTVQAGTLVLAGTLASAVLAVDGGTLQLAAAERLPDAAAVTVAPGATLALAGAERIGSLTLAGTLQGSGVLGAAQVALAGGTADAALGAGTLTSTGSSTLNATSQAQRVDVTAGTLTLGSAGRWGATPAVDVAAGATLALGGDERLGTLGGAGAVALGAATLRTGAAGDSLFAGAFSGAGRVVKEGAGRFTLAGASSHGGGTTVEAGTLRLQGAERLADGAPLGVARGATLSLDGTETVNAARIAGTLDGSGTLVASHVTLDGALVQAALVSGTLASLGDTTLAATARAGSVGVDSGTLSLAGADRLPGAPAMAVAIGATLALGGAETLGTLSGAGTVALGPATLATGSSGDSRFDGSLTGAGALVKQGAGRFTLAGLQQHTGATQVDAGTLALAGPGRLAGGGTVGVAPGATLALGGDERVAALLLQGTLAGSGTLTAPQVTLDGGTAQAALGAGTLDSRGSSVLAATAGAAAVTVSDGTLTLTAPERLADDAVVQVAAGGRLQLAGAERIGALNLQGTLAGSGTLSAARYSLDGGTVVADLGSGTLRSAGNSRIEGRAAVSALDVDSGQLTLAAAGRLAALPAVSVAAGGLLALGGDETWGTLAGLGQVALGAATLGTGQGGDARFDGSLTGSGGLSKLGDSRFTLTGTHTYTGSTRVDAGTLELGAGGNGGSLATDRFVLQGTLRLNRADTVVLAQPISGSGQLEQAGTGRLTLAGRNKTYTGATRVLASELATTGDDALPDASAVSVAAGARLVLGGAQTLRSLDADGSVELAGPLGASGALRFGGAVVARGGAPLRLSAQTISAVNDGNRWGSELALVADGPVDIASGRDNGLLRDLVLGRVDLGAGGRIDAGTLRLDGSLTLTGGTLTLSAAADAVPLAPTPELLGKNTPINRPLAFAADVVSQGAAGVLDVGAGATLSVLSPQGGSVQLLGAANRVAGQLEVISGGPFAPWSGREVASSLGSTALVSLQSRVQLQGTELRVGGRGIEADLVRMRADRLSTAPGAVIAARLPFDNLVGTVNSVPGLTLELTPQAFQQSFPFGQRGGNEIAIDVGSRAWGNRSLPIDGGYITVLPRNGAQGVTAVILTGPRVQGSYGFFFDGAGNQAEIPVLYNGVLPVTPQVSSSISATLAVSESARRQGFEEAVRTENVAVRLRAGVFAEVGPGRPATVGTEGLRLPSVCEPAGASLACDVSAGRTPR